MKTITVDDGWAFQSSLHVIEFDFSANATDGSSDLRYGNKGSHIQHFGSRQHQHRAPFASNLGEPQFASPHCSPHASAWRQNTSGRSGCLRYASRSDRASAARTAAATPSRAAAETLTPNSRARSARFSSRLNVVRTVAILQC